MLLHSLRLFCKAQGGAGSIWKYLEALARATGVSDRFAHGFRTELSLADAATITRRNAHRAHLIRIQHCQKETCFRPVSQQVHHLRGTHVCGVCRSLE